MITLNFVWNEKLYALESLRDKSNVSLSNDSSGKNFYSTQEKVDWMILGIKIQEWKA